MCVRDYFVLRQYSELIILLHSAKQTDDRSATKSKEANAGKKTSVHNCEFM